MMYIGIPISYLVSSAEIIVKIQRFKKKHSNIMTVAANGIGFDASFVFVK